MRSSVGCFLGLAFVVLSGCSAFGGQSGTESTDLEGRRRPAPVGDSGADPTAPNASEEFLELMFHGENQWLVSLPNDRKVRPGTTGECLPVGATDLDSGCLAEQRCQNADFEAKCEYGEETECSCTAYGREHRFWLPSTVESACEAAIESCRNEDIDYADLVCTAASVDVVTGASCTARRECEAAVTVGSLDASKHDVQESWCTPHPDGGLDCSCKTVTEQASYHFAESDLEMGCKLALDICTEARDASKFARTSACLSELEGEEDGVGCILGSDCRYEAEVSDGITQTAGEEAVIGCEFKPESGWRCYCDLERPDLWFEVVDNPMGSGICTQFPLSCHDLKGETVLRDGHCAPPETSASDDECSASVECELESDLEGVEVVLHDDWSVSCAKDEPLLGWRCDCNGPKYQAISTYAETSAGACDAALTECSGLVEQWASLVK